MTAAWARSQRQERRANDDHGIRPLISDITATATVTITDRRQTGAINVTVEQAIAFWDTAVRAATERVIRGRVAA